MNPNLLNIRRSWTNKRIWPNSWGRRSFLLRAHKMWGVSRRLFREWPTDSAKIYKRQLKETKTSEKPTTKWRGIWRGEFTTRGNNFKWRQSGHIGWVWIWWTVMTRRIILRSKPQLWIGLRLTKRISTKPNSREKYRDRKLYPGHFSTTRRCPFLQAPRATSEERISWLQPKWSRILPESPKHYSERSSTTHREFHKTKFPTVPCSRWRLRTSTTPPTATCRLHTILKVDSPWRSSTPVTCKIIKRFGKTRVCKFQLMKIRASSTMTSKPRPRAKVNWVITKDQSKWTISWRKRMWGKA